jgi:hypothetical protein
MIVKLILTLTSIIALIGSVLHLSCNKDDYMVGPAPPTPPKATINFHIKNSIVPAYGVYLYRIISYPTSNVYDSTKNIYLRTGVDTTFNYAVEGNTNNLFSVGVPDPDEIPYYMESRYLVAGSNINWEIEY